MKRISVPRKMTIFLLFGIIFYFGLILVYTINAILISGIIYLAIIPARMASSRFPGKPMAKIHGIPMIGHNYSNIFFNDNLVSAEISKSYGTTV